MPVLDRTTGDLVEADIGDWITVSELGERYGVGNRRVRAILHHMGVLQREGDRYRLPHASVAKGYGKRIESAKLAYPFDVLSPLCQAMIAEVWDDTVADYEADRAAQDGIPEASRALADFETHRGRTLQPQQKVCWLLDHCDGLTLSAIAAIIEVDRGLVSRYAGVRERQIEAARRRRTAVLPKGERVRVDVTTAEGCV